VALAELRGENGHRPDARLTTKPDTNPATHPGPDLTTCTSLSSAARSGVAVATRCYIQHA